MVLLADFYGTFFVFFLFTKLIVWVVQPDYKLRLVRINH